MTDLMGRICQLDRQRWLLQKRLDAALALIDGFTQRWTDQWTDEPGIVVHDQHYYENKFLLDLLDALENDR